ncbi:MAG: PAP/fibrillin family protein [cyanobacterium endosymbiont of Rhopalodia musculus]|uniref:PAP/fibrillin family protein n=1 Tax=cyanobacterium endosymbiont of Epithemia clementina EcSB TaxID=3034674 RepID=UPI0024816B3A|nr:PAP/fibrillin family protein [cyanobacterium endosymbiont of Epithemia clementina EcSB]WGT66825.1 PAP/fibrillin family protein [cyanobacterium endosymbiont of Epithemia clementina EcSB]
MNEKARLLETIAGKNRGLLATEMDRVRVLSALEQLEDHNPIPQTLEAKEFLDGNWRLLYTTSKGILGLDRLPILQLGQIYQCLRMADGKLYNIAEIIGVPFLEGLVSVIAKFEVVSDRRINVKFERYIIGPQRLLGYRSPTQLIKDIEAGKKFFPLDFSIESQEQKGWLEITYLDDDLRVGRGNEGNVFVLSKEKGI